MSRHLNIAEQKMINDVLYLARTCLYSHNKSLLKFVLIFYLICSSFWCRSNKNKTRIFVFLYLFRNCIFVNLFTKDRGSKHEFWAFGLFKFHNLTIWRLCSEKRRSRIIIWLLLNEWVLKYLHILNEGSFDRKSVDRNCV